MKKIQLLVFLIIIIAFLIRFALVIIHSLNPHFVIQQDNYATYAQALKSGTVHNLAYDSRLFPGYPLLIFILSPFVGSEIKAGLVISIISAILALYILWLLTKNFFLVGLFSFFPPIWVIQATKVSTEPLTVLLLLVSIFLFLKKKYFFAGSILGLCFNVRIIAVALYFTYLLWSYKFHDLNVFFRITLSFIIFSSSLFIFNFFIFGSDKIFYQFNIYPLHGRGTVGATQIIQDIFRSLDWKQYRIFFSGIFYLSISLISAYNLYRRRFLSKVYWLFSYWSIFSLIFIFSYGPTPLLEEFSRYIVPFSPAINLGLIPVKFSFNVIHKKSKI